MALRKKSEPASGQIESEVVALLSVCSIGDNSSRMTESVKADGMDRSARNSLSTMDQGSETAKTLTRSSS